MSRRLLRYLFPLAVALAVLVTVAPAFADDEEGDGEEQGEVEGDDRAEGEGEEAEGEGVDTPDHPAFQNQGATQGGVAGTLPDDYEWKREFHPKYEIEHKRDQDVASWTHGFTMNYPLSRKISFSSSANINTRSNDASNRLSRQERWNAGLDMRVSGAITTGLKFRRSKHVDLQNEGKPNETRSAREKETVKLSTSYHKTHMSGLDISLGATAGIEKNKYTDVKSRGATQGITGKLVYKPIEGLNTSFSYGGSHSLLDSEQGSLESTDESSSHDLSSHIDYKWLTHNFIVDVKRTSSQQEYPKNEQTELKEQEGESTSATANLQLLQGLTAKIGFSYARNQLYYRIEPSRNNDITTRGVEGHVTYDLDGTTFKADLTSDRKRNEYFDVQTGRNYSNTLSMSLTHQFREGLDMSVRGRMNLLSVQYDDIENNDQDRDLFDREGTLTLNYRMRKDVSTGLTVKVKEDQLIYIRRTRTGDNKTTQKYAIEPFIRKTFSPKISASQKYQLSADYTFYDYDNDSNFLIRNMTITTGFNWKPFTPLELGFDHTWRAQDEGSYVEDAYGVEGYGKNSERRDHRLGLTLNYKIADLVTIEVKQSLSVQNKWKFVDGEKVHSWEKFDASVVGRASTEYSLDDGTTLKVTVARTHRDATSISDRQREVWNISANLSRTF
jgi:hypothetical protein